MPSDRIQRQIDHLLDEAEAAVSGLDWDVVRDRAQAVLAFDPDNSDALEFRTAAERALGATLVASTIDDVHRGEPNSPSPSPVR